jgi:predicted porin
MGYERFGAKTGTVATDATLDAWKANVGYSFGDIKVGYTYEKSADQYANTVANPQADDTAHLVSVTYGMGPITLAAQYGKFNDKANGTTATGGEDANKMSRWTVGVIYSLSNRTNVYAAYDADNYKADNETTQNGVARRDAKIWTFGLNHSF